MHRTIISAVLATLATATSALASNSFHSFALSTGGGSAVFGLSADGSVATGVSDGTVYRWTAATGPTFISNTDFIHIFASAVSADGTTIAASQMDSDGLYNAARWTESGGWQTLGGLPGQTSPDGAELSIGFGVSGDGSSVVGLGWHSNFRAEAVQWTQATGMVGLGRPSEGNSRASAISADGHTVAGFYEGSDGTRYPARWIDGAAVDLFLGDATPGDAAYTSSNGQLITGNAILDPNQPFGAAFLYAPSGTTNLGVLQDSGFGFDTSRGNAVSDNGIVVGFSGDQIIARTQDGFVWDEVNGMVRILDYLTAHDVVVPSNLLFTTVTAISADGLTLGGQAFDLDDPSGFATVSWIATVPEPTSGLLFLAAGAWLRRRR